MILLSAPNQPRNQPKTACTCQLPICGLTDSLMLREKINLQVPTAHDWFEIHWIYERKWTCLVASSSSLDCSALWWKYSLSNILCRWHHHRRSKWWNRQAKEAIGCNIEEKEDQRNLRYFLSGKLTKSWNCSFSQKIHYLICWNKLKAWMQAKGNAHGSKPQVGDK